MARRGTIRRQLMVLLFVVLFPLLALFVAFLLVAWRNATERASESTIAMARSEARKIAALVTEATALADRLAERPMVRRARAADCDPLLVEAQQLMPHLEFIAIANEQGQIVCSTMPPMGGRMPNVSDVSWFRAALTDLTPGPSDPFRSRITGRWISAVLRRLSDAGRTTGVLGVAIDLVGLEELFASSGLPEGTTITVVDGHGTVVSRVPETAEWVGQNAKSVEIGRLVLDDGERVVEAAGLDGVQRIYAYTTVPGTAWRVYAGVPVAIAYAPVRNLTRLGVAAIVIAVLLSALFSTVVIRNIERPIRHLERGIETLPTGGDRVTIPADSPQELAAVVDAINELLLRRADAERAIAEHGRLLEGILDGASDLISVRDLDARMVHVNAATLRWLGLPREQVIGRLAAELSDDPGAKRLDDEARRVIETGEPSVSEDVLFDARRDEVFVMTRAPLRDKSGNIAGVIVAAKDVSALRHNERERIRLAGEVRRREAVSALGALVGSVAHEVRNPLFAISSTLDALVARFKSQADLAPYLDVLRRETTRLNKIMNDLLEYGRARAEELKPDRVEPVVQAAVDLCRPQAYARRVRLEVRMVAGLPIVCMDRDRLLMAIRNIVDNAVRHAPTGSAVAVRVSAESAHGGGVEFQVRDRGPGFSPEDIDRLFEPFITRRPGGIGLGLYLVKRVIEDHGGRVTIENAREGGGLVRLWIPADGAPRDAAASTTDERSPPT